MNTAGFDLVRLITTVFEPKPTENLGIFVDLKNPQDLACWKFLKDPTLTTQRIAHDVFYQGLLNERSRLPFASTRFYAYEPTGGSNLDLPSRVVDSEGKTLRLVEDVLSQIDIVLYLTTYSATAPLTALAKEIGFRGATMHGCNEQILRTGLSKNYEEVSAKAERLRQALTCCDSVQMEFETLGHKARLTLELDRQQAQKSHGLCREPGEIANLPAGEIYWVPAGAHGQFPVKFKDGTLALMDVSMLRVHNVTLLRGDPGTVAAAANLFQSDPATGEIGELGLGTQDLPPAGADIQDEKILGTAHLATGRNDHLGGGLDPSRFFDKRHATHEDILFAPQKTPEIALKGIWMHKDGRETQLIKDYQATEFVKALVL